MIRRALLFASPVLSVAAVAAAQPTAPRWRLVEDQRLDAAREAFTELTTARVGPRGRVVVAMHEDYRVRIYDPTALHSATVGGVGSRPGEFTQLSTFGWVADTLWIHDGLPRRISYYSPDGALLRVRPLPEPPIALAPGPGASVVRTLAPATIHADGAMLARATVSSGGASGVQQETVSAIVHVSPAGTVRLVAEIADDGPNLISVSTGSRGRAGVSVPFAIRPHVAASPDGGRVALLTTAFTSGAAGMLTLRWFGPDGAPLLERTYPFAGSPIPAQVVDSAVRRARESVSARGGRAAGAAEIEMLIRQRIPPAYAPVVFMFLGLDGTTWLGLRPSSEGTITLVLDERGDPIGNVRAPARSVILQGSRTHIWVTERTTGQPISVVRYRVEKP